MSAPTDPTLDLVAELPRGRLAIQASAGTGKTFALAALATRFIAEADVATSELLVVTFTRAATSELRSRVRDRIVHAAEHLAAVADGAERDSGDELLRHLADVDDQELARRVTRLVRAVTEFDAATVTTIHGFAAQVLATLGATAGIDPDAVLVDDSADLAAQCCADVLAAASATVPADQLPKHEPLVVATRTAINVADMRVVPDGDADGADESGRLLVQLVEKSIRLMRLRRRQAGTISFDDILVELRRAIDGSGGDAVLDTLRSRFRVALIDEFQDTDPVQWDIFGSLFPGVAADPDQPTLVLVGDPKQAIYAFRGANVHTFLQAVDADTGVQRRSLGTNWRSDAALVDATRQLLAGTTYGDDAIRFTEVAAAEKNRDTRLVGVDGAELPAISIRLALEESLQRNSRDDISTGEAEKAVMADMVARIRELLDDARRRVEDPEAPAERLRPSDIAVLVRTRSEADAAQAALLSEGVPAVLARGGSVLESPAAEQWRWLLEGMARPADPARARTFALSWFAGHSPGWILAADDSDLGALQDRLHDWSQLLADRGVTELVRRVWTESGVLARVLARPGGDRDVTDLDHVAELLGAGVSERRASPAGLLAVLDAPAPIEIDADIDRDVRSRRVESEAQAVQVMTVWVAKGLEFPVVCCPTLWRAPRAGDVIYQDPDTDQRTFDVTRGASWPDAAHGRERKAWAAAERDGEQLRLLYVALTRAKHQSMVWWSRCQGSRTTALAKVLFARDPAGRIDPQRFAEAVELPPDEDALAALAPLLDGSDGTIVAGVHGRPGRPGSLWVDPSTGTSPPELSVARVSARPPRVTNRWSFTAIADRSRIDHGDPFDTSLGDGGAEDEVRSDEGEDGSLVAGSAEGLAMLPAGAAFGTLVHSVLEVVDFSADDLDDQLREALDRARARRPFDLEPDDDERLVSGLRLAIETPLGEAFDDRPLRSVERADRLDEMSFELRLGDGVDHATGRDIGRLLERHLAPVDLFDVAPFHDWARAVAAGRFHVDLAGHLTGSIDLVARLVDADGTPRFVVMDYKTNRLSPFGQVPERDDYAPAALARAMVGHDYPLQAVLYSAALHRYLRWRQPGYDPRVHLGGVAYLFLRGMVGSRTPGADGRRHGVAEWMVPTELVVELSDLLAARLPAGSR